MRTLRLLVCAVAVMIGCATLQPITIDAQVLPLTVNLGVTPDTSANPAMGYTVSLDGAAAVDVGLPAVITCRDFVGSKNGPCVPFSVQITTAGTHTVSVIAYNLGGNSPATSFTFQVTAAPGSGQLRLVK